MSPLMPVPFLRADDAVADGDVSAAQQRQADERASNYQELRAAESC